MSIIDFDEATHTYRVQGKVVPSVTQILKPVVDFSFVPHEVLANASKFGTAVHLATELDDLRELDESSLDERIVPYLSAWRTFSKNNNVSWHGIEQRIYNDQFKYCGTIDRVGKVNGKQSVVDLKTSAGLYPSYALQTAAYQRAVNPAFDRLVVQLKADGTYQIKKYESPTDWAVFCSLLTLTSWAKEKNVVPNFSHLKE